MTYCQGLANLLKNFVKSCVKIIRKNPDIIRKKYNKYINSRTNIPNKRIMWNKIKDYIDDYEWSISIIRNINYSYYLELRKKYPIDKDIKDINDISRSIKEEQWIKLSG